MCSLRRFGGYVTEEFFNINGKPPLALKWLLNHEYVADADITVQEASLINGPPPWYTVVGESEIGNLKEDIPSIECVRQSTRPSAVFAWVNS